MVTKNELDANLCICRGIETTVERKGRRKRSSVYGRKEEDK